MKKSSTCLLAVAISLAASWPLLAADTWEKSREELAAQRSQARQIRIDALKAFDADSEKCNQEIFPSSCIDKARKARDDREAEALRIEKAVIAEEKRIQQETRAARKASQEEKDRREAGAGNKKAIELQMKREKLLREIEKTRLPPAELPAGR